MVLWTCQWALHLTVGQTVPEVLSLLHYYQQIVLHGVLHEAGLVFQLRKEKFKWSKDLFCAITEILIWVPRRTMTFRGDNEICSGGESTPSGRKIPLTVAIPERGRKE